MMTASNHSFRPLAQQWGFLFIPCALALLLLWLPFGFSIMGLLEEWDVLAVFTLHGSQLWVDADSPLAAHRLRPLTVAPHSLGYLLDRNSFFYWHVLLIASLLVKGVSGTLMGWWLTRSRRWSVLLGLLVVFYPADTMQLSFRSFHINWAISLGLLGVTLCALAFTLPTRWQRTLAMVIAVPCAMLGTFAYEAALTYAAIPFLLLYARFGLRGTVEQVRQHRWVTASWVLAAVCSFLYMLVVIRTGNTYQGALVDGAGGHFMLGERLLKLFQVGYGRSLGGGWLDALAILRFEYRSYVYLAVCLVAGVLAIRCFSSAGAQDPDEPNGMASASALRLCLVGLAIILLGYLPFLPSLPHLQISQRTYLSATPGAALVVIAVLIAISRRARGLALVLAGVATLLGFSTQLYQFEHYRRLSEQQQTLLGDIVGNMPPPSLDKTLVIIDRREQLNDVWMVREGMVMALSYLYNRELNRPVICTPANQIWQYVNAQGRVGHCVETADGWELTEAAAPAGAPAVPPRHLARADAVVVTLEPDGTTRSSVDTTEYRRLLAHSDAPVARRYREILRRPAWPLDMDMFRRQVGGNTFHWDFGRWWSMEQPVRGAGWVPGGWSTFGSRMPLLHSVAWKDKPVATLQFDLLPDAGTYRLAMRVRQMVAPTSPETLHVSLNGHPLQLQWSDTAGFTARVEPQWLRAGVNELRLESPDSEDPSRVSLLADWVDLRPEH